MAVMWTGPSAALLATYGNMIHRRLLRRAGERGIAFRYLDNHGRQIEAHHMIRQSDGTYSCPVIGTVQGGDPMNTIINASLAFTPHDAELFALIADNIVRRENEVHELYHAAVKRLDGMCDTISDSLFTLRRRYVRA